MMKRILVATDFSTPSLAAIRYGLDLAKTAGAEIILLHVIEDKPVCLYVVGRRPVFLRDEFNPDIDLSRWALPQRIIRRDRCEEAYRKLAALYPPAYQSCVRTVVTVGRPAREIVRVAREHNADLIVLGSPGRGGLRRLLRRTVTDMVMRKAPMLVIAVDADDYNLGGAPGRSTAPNKRIEGDHDDFQGDARVHRTEAMVRACGNPDAPTASPLEGSDGRAEDLVQPLGAPFKTRIGQHVTKRSRAIKAPARREP